MNPNDRVYRKPGHQHADDKANNGTITHIKKRGLDRTPTWVWVCSTTPGHVRTTTAPAREQNVAGQLPTAPTNPITHWQRTNTRHGKCCRHNVFKII